MNSIDGIAMVIVLIIFFFGGVGVQFKNPKFGASIYNGWKKITHLFKKRQK